MASIKQPETRSCNPVYIQKLNEAVATENIFFEQVLYVDAKGL